MAEILKFVSISFLLITSWLANIQCHQGGKALSDEQRRIAEKYLTELSSGDKSSWVDPYDMFASAESSSSDEKTQNRMKERDQVEESMKDRNHVQHENRANSAVVDDEGISRDVDNHKGQSSTVSKTCCQCSNIMGPFTMEKGNKSVLTEFVFVSRWLKIFLAKVNSHTEADSPLEKIVTFTLTESQLSKMRNILNNAGPNILDVETVVLDILSSATIAERESWFSLLQHMFLENEKLLFVFVILVIIIVVIYVVQYFPYSWRSICMIIIVVSVGFKWKQLYEEALSKKAATLEKIEYPTACKRANFDIFDSVKFYVKSFFVSSGTCEEYYKALMVDPFWDINLMKVISLAFSEFFFAPLETFAMTLNVVLKNLLSDLPLLYVVVMVFLISITLIMYFNYRIRFPLFFASIEPYAPTATVASIQDKRNSALQQEVITSITKVKQLLCDDDVMKSPCVKSNSLKHMAEVNSAGDYFSQNVCRRCSHETMQAVTTAPMNEIGSSSDSVTDSLVITSQKVLTNTKDYKPLVKELCCDRPIQSRVVKQNENGTAEDTKQDSHYKQPLTFETELKSFEEENSLQKECVNGFSRGTSDTVKYAEIETNPTDQVVKKMQ